MNRLTEHYGKYIRVKGCKTLYPAHERKGAYTSNCIVRLAAYEDMELEPEDVKQLKDDIESRFLVWIEKHYGICGARFTELLQAEREGRCVVLPCKVGDTAYVLDDEDEDGGDDCIFEGNVVAINIGCGGTTVKIGHMEHKCWFAETERRISDLNTDWYLTREEAEAAQGGGGDALS